MTISADEAQRVLDRAQLLYDEAAVETALDSMAGEISGRIGDRLPLVLCVLTGGLIPTGKLLTRLRFPLEIDYLHATRYQGEIRGGELSWLARPRTPLEDRTVLIVDDILDEGYTLAGIIEHCRAEGAREVLSAVLVDKQHDRRYDDLKADFVGLQVEDRYVFGAGMDYKGLLRNLPGIYAVQD